MSNSNSLNLKIDLGYFTNKLRANIHSDIRVLESLNFPETKVKLTNKVIGVKFGLIDYSINPTPWNNIQDREIIKSFKSIVSSLHDYLDELITAINLSKEPLTYRDLKWHPPLIQSAAFDNMYKTRLLSYSQKRNVPVLEKLKIVLPLTADHAILDSLQSMFGIRNGMEHHKGLANTHKSLRFKKIVLLNSEGEELDMLGGHTKGVSLSTIDEIIKFSTGHKLQLSKEQLYSMVSSLLLYGISTIERSVIDIVNQKSKIPYDNLSHGKCSQV